MNHVQLTTHVSQSADDAYARLADFRAYPKLADSILSVEVEETGDGTATVRWQTKFRDGILRWTEQDHFDPQARTIRFQQTEGDVEVFEGDWRIEPNGTGSQITFNADLDLGIPSLSAFLNPVAADALRENITAILTGLFGDDLTVQSG